MISSCPCELVIGQPLTAVYANGRSKVLLREVAKFLAFELEKNRQKKKKKLSSGI